MEEDRKKQIRILRTEITFGLGLQGHSVKSLADGIGVKPSTLRKAFYSSFPRGELIISRALGIEPSVLWPDRYKDGKPIKRGPWKKYQEAGVDVKQNLMAPEKEDAE